MKFADNWARIIVVMTFLGLETANTYFANVAFVGGLITNLLAFGLFCGAIGYFLFTGPLFGIGKNDGYLANC